MLSHQRSHEVRSETKAGGSRRARRGFCCQPEARAAKECCDKTVFISVGELEEPQTYEFSA